MKTSVIEMREARRELSVGEADPRPSGIMIGKRSNSSARDGERERDRAKRRSNTGVCCTCSSGIPASLASSEDRVR